MPNRTVAIPVLLGFFIDQHVKYFSEAESLSCLQVIVEMHTRLLQFFFYASGMFLLVACTPMLLMGGAATAVVVNDARSGEQLMRDKDIEFDVSERLQADPELLRKTHINVATYNQIVLLTGQAPTEELRLRAGALAEQEEKIRKVYNEIKVRDKLPFKARNFDFWLSTKIKSKLLGAQGLDGLNVKIVCSDTSVYLMGLVTRAHGEQVVQRIAEVEGVTRIVKAFEYIDG